MTMTIEKTVHPQLGDLCIMLCERADALRYKGKRANEFALDSFIAAAHGARAAGDEEAARHWEVVASLIIAARGMAEVRYLAHLRREDIQNERAAEATRAAGEAALILDSTTVEA